MRPNRCDASRGQSRMAGRRRSIEPNATTADQARAKQSMGMVGRSLFGCLGCAGRLLHRHARHARRNHTDWFHESDKPTRKYAADRSRRLAGTSRGTGTWFWRRNVDRKMTRKTATILRVVQPHSKSNCEIYRGRASSFLLRFSGRRASSDT